MFLFTQCHFLLCGLSVDVESPVIDLCVNSAGLIHALNVVRRTKLMVTLRIPHYAVGSLCFRCTAILSYLTGS